MTVRRVLLIGAGGHARVCLEALLDDSSNEVVGCVSSTLTAIDGLGVPLLGGDADLGAIVVEHDVTHTFVAIGNNAARAIVARRCAEAGLSVITATSRYARLSRTATIEPGVAVLPGATVNAATTIGAGAILNTNCSVDHDCSIGAFAHIAPGVAIAGGVTVGEGAFLGIGARVIPGITIGERAVVGAGSTVIRDVPADAVVVGVPARQLPARQLPAHQPPTERAR